MGFCKINKTTMNVPFIEPEDRIRSALIKCLRCLPADAGYPGDEHIMSISHTIAARLMSPLLQSSEPVMGVSCIDR